MATTSGQALRGTDSTRHSKEDALTDREFELLLEGARQLDTLFALQARFAILIGGRLGLRPGEIAHMRESWVDWRRQVIDIPHHQPCEKGKDGGICGYCEMNAKQMVDHDEELSIEEARARLWSPKTDMAVRDVPFDFDARVQLIVERFFDKFDRWPLAKSGVNRRVKRASKAAEEIAPGDVYPHALRATAATFHAGRGLDVLPLQSLMGWAQPSTAENYVQRSTENTRRALHMIHSR